MDLDTAKRLDMSQPEGRGAPRGEAVQAPALRLLMITQDFPPDVGGTQTYAYELAQRMARQCADFAVIAPSVPGAEEFDANAPFEIHRVRSSYDTFTAAAFLPMLRLARERGFDTTFHVQWPAAWAALTARWLRRIRRVFIAAHGRELLLEPMAAPINPFYRFLRKRIITHADGLFPVSRYTSGLLQEAGVDAGRITVVPNGTDPHRFAPNDASAFRQHLNLTDRRVALTVGRLVPRKGIDTVISALPRVAKAVPNVVYLVAGDGPDRERLENLARSLGVSDRVRFLGKIPDDHLPLHFNACDLFVMPSRPAVPNVEGFGIVFLEANACGKPVIGTHSGGIPDAVREGETGLLVEPDAPEALAEAMISLLSDSPYANRLGQQGRARVLAESTWNHIANELLTAINGIGDRFSNTSL